ncbi:gamma-glutamyl-gamma-aminobutyrate hydrolase family protein [Alicyclobacillus cycloheptanicus]
MTGYHVMPEEGFGGKLRGTPGQGFSVVGHDYIRSVDEAGGLAFGVPVLDEARCPQIIATLDGIVFSGGEDLDPRTYGARPDSHIESINPDRDRFELALLTEAIRQLKPTLCICRGLQLLNVAFGGTLHKHIPAAFPDALEHQKQAGPRWYLAHKAYLEDDVLKGLYGTDCIEVNTFHHQSVDRVGAGLRVTAVAEDGVIEGLAHSDMPQLLAIQWHPEMMSARYDDGLIPFRWLVNQCRGAGIDGASVGVDDNEYR